MRSRKDTSGYIAPRLLLSVACCDFLLASCCSCAIFTQDGHFQIYFVDAGSISGEGGVFEFDQFASRPFSNLCFIL